jgi:hypothetical protein
MKSGNEYFTIYNKNGNYCIRIKKDFEEPTEIYLQHLNFFESCIKKMEQLKCYYQFYNIFLIFITQN